MSHGAAATLMDQAVSSISNTALTLVVASQLQPRAFGAYALVIGLYLLALSIGQALIGEPYLVLSHDTAARRASYASTAALQLGIALGAIVAVAAPVIGGILTAPLLVLACLLPALLWQDALRFVAIAERRPVEALASDGTWATLQFALTLGLFARGDPTVASLVGAWGLGAIAGGALAAGRLRVRPRALLTLTWMTDSVHLGGRYLVEALSTVGVFQVVLALTGSIAGLSAAGALRLGQTVFGPIHVAYNGAKSYLTPRFASAPAADEHGTKTDAVRWSAGLTGLCVLCYVVLLALPRSIEANVLGPTWPLTRTILLLVFLQKTAECAGLGAFAILRARRRAPTTMRVRVVVTGTSLLISPIALLLAGLTGAAATLAAASAVASVVWWTLVGNASERADARAARVLVVGHAYNEPEVAKNLVALARQMPVLLLAPSRHRALVFDDQPIEVPRSPGLVVMRARRMPLPRGQFLLLTLGRHIRSFGPTVVYVEYEPWTPMFWQVRLLRRLWAPTAPLVVLAKKNTYVVPRSPVGVVKRVMTRRGMRSVDLVIAASARVARIYESVLAVPPDRVVVHPHLGIDTTLFAPPGSPPPPGPLVVGFAGNVSYPKGIADLAAACALVRERTGWDVRLRIAGPERHRELARSLAALPWVDLVGVLPNGDIPGFLAGCHVFCMPTHVLPDHEEHDARALLEAMAMGLPCVATRSGIMAELLADGVGALCDPGDVPGLAEALEGVLADTRGSWERARNVTRPRALDLIELDQHAARRAQLFRRLVDAG